MRSLSCYLKTRKNRKQSVKDEAVKSKDEYFVHTHQADMKCNQPGVRRCPADKACIADHHLRLGDTKNPMMTALCYVHVHAS